MTAPPPAPTTVVIDMANVLGARPDGWWRDRAGATARLLTLLPDLLGAAVKGPGLRAVRVDRLVAVLAGAARDVSAPPGVDVVRAMGAGDDAVVESALSCLAAGEHVLVVSADRGLRDRLPAKAATAGPGWFRVLIGA